MAALSVRVKQSLSKHFGEESVAELEQLLAIQPHHSVEALPQGALALMAGVLRSASDADLPPQASRVTAVAGVPHGWDAKAHLLPMHTNASAILNALTSFPHWNPEVSSAFGERLLQMPEADFKLLAAPGGGDYAALCFLGWVLQNNMSAAELAHALQKPEGRRFIKTFRTSPTLGAVVIYASWSVFDWLGDLLDWLEGAAKWVLDAVKKFGEEATKLAKAVVDSVFSSFPNATEIVSNIPGLGMVVAGIYAIAGDRDEAVAAFAVNVHAIVNVVGAAVGFYLGGTAGAMAGGALGEALGLLFQNAIAEFIHDPKLKAKTGDINATRFIIDLALSGASAGAAGAIGKELGKELGLSTIKTFATSQTLSGLLANLPKYFALEALDG